MTPEERLDRHRAIAAALEAIGDEDLAEWLGASEPLRRDGFARLTLPGGGSPAFVKLLPVTDLELEPHNWLSGELLRPAALLRLPYRGGGLRRTARAGGP